MAGRGTGRPGDRNSGRASDAERWTEILGRTALFRGLAAAEQSAVARAATRNVAARRGSFFEQGDRPCRLHLLLRGRVSLIQSGADGQEVILRLIGPGEIFALTAVLDEVSYPVSARAVEESEALVWDGAAIEELLQRFPRIARNAVEILLHRIREVEDRYRELATERVAQRLARTLLRLVRHSGRRAAEEKGVRIDMPLSRETLARLSGTTLFTVSRLLKEWEQRGILVAGREHVRILSPHALVVIAEDLGSRDDTEDEGET
ncbi:MAG: Crp/Fnr family transcriptional regulator [Candidatus Eisenbacteria bacterium]|nr:Crp/Fnr family transcriptional regulator [Candidatus Eisenbacteria bacterium]